MGAWREVGLEEAPLEGAYRMAEAVIELAVRYCLRVGDAPLQFSRADDLRIFPKGRLITRC
jgi:hypothetical protein